MRTVGVTRPRRRPLPMPGGELALEPPPEPERVIPAGVLSRLLPVVMIAASIGFVAVLGPGNPTSWLFGGMFVISTLGMMLTGGGRGGGQRAAGIDEDRRDYLRYLGSMRRRMREIAAAQRGALENGHPEPAAWPSVLAAGRLWERRTADVDFGRLRIGCGTQRLATRLIAPQTGPVEGVEPVTALALRRFLTGHSVVAELPVAVSVRHSSTVWLEPADHELAPARGLARAMVAQYALWHSPTDALLAVVAPPSLAAAWEWAKWLPHVAHPRLRDAIGPLRMFTADADELRRWWITELAGRPPGPGEGEPHLLVVVDGMAATPGPWAGVAGVTVLRVGAPPGRRPAPSVVRLAVGPARLARLNRNDPVGAEIGRPDALSVAEARALARRLARYRPAGAASGDEDTAAGPTGLPALLGIAERPGPAAVEELRERWGKAEADRLRVPIGVDERGQPVALDLKESAHGGSGPHGLCVGATGSGKSELLRTLVLGLAATHSPADLNLVLVDFKGGATFLGFAELPHVSAVITNLVDELTLVDRMADALAGEITRRQELLRAAGNLTDVTGYAAARRAGADLPPLPALLVVVDEFSELLAQRPELIDLLVTIGRLGRSLGLHLLLASQRLDEGRLRGLESHLSYRIALRTFSAAESRAVLGVPDAHQLPPAPGSAFLATGTGELVRFRGAYVSGPPAGSTGPGPSGQPRALPFRAGRVRAPSTGSALAAPGDTAPTVLDGMLDALRGRGPAAHRVWMPPLDVPPPLDELLGPITPTAGRGLSVGGPVGTLQVPIGLIDRPYQQRRDPLVADLSGAAGHLVVVGGPRSGKSTALRALVLGLALTHTPAELGVHVLDFGGGGLAALAGLPHVGTVADRQQPDLVRRTLAEVNAVLTRRERLFRDAGLGAVEEFRTRRARGEFAGEPATDLLLVLDGYLTLRAEFEDLEARLLPLATQGLGYGVHLALSASRWTELRPALKDLLGTRLELRLGEPSESEAERRKAAGVPARPGHGLAADGAPMVLAAPRCGEHADTPSLVEAIARSWSGPPVAPVRLLPTRLEHVALAPGDPTRVPLGVDEDRLALVELDFAAEPHLFCFADAESGKTNLLRLLARGITDRFTPEQARVVLVDYRRGLFGAVAPSHLIGHASTAEAAATALREVAESLRRRLPGPDVTARQLRERSWWSGPEVFVLVDDYDLVAPIGATVANPLLPLVEFLPQAKDVGLHLVVTRRCGGAGRALYDPLLSRLRELAAPGLVMNGSPDEGALVESVKPAPMPPGRAVLVDRRRGPRRVQLAWLPDPGDAP
ncbi:type VII secretion protein EccC [Pseudonocardia asaccharolytica]|uniref:Type VII secretion protein EccC n=1 Tax=Pseudonocardia asaccharolytica DSM 44247 = NBRC 16224 TaxID=1123024 RepID=A0A511CUJ5_9PSEU|nr:type VII secretion protein EccC [Pseudonocardia asaccharolytica]GEL16250.1 type VII secretion protein EccC [Pseudonocardia asaccharolytica DSM 44247 = NBRC 16224]